MCLPKVFRERGIAKLRMRKKTGGVGNYKQQISRDVTIRQPVELYTTSFLPRCFVLAYCDVTGDLLFIAPHPSRFFVRAQFGHTSLSKYFGLHWRL